MLGKTQLSLRRMNENPPYVPWSLRLHHRLQSNPNHLPLFLLLIQVKAYDSSGANLFLRRISLHRLCLPSSNRLILRVVPLGLPMMIGFHSSSGPVRMFVPNRLDGITCTILNRQRTPMSKIVRTNSTAATTAVAVWAPRRRSIAPPDPVAAAAIKKAKDCTMAKAAATRGKHE